ncbi:NAD(P)/FAD-dependent oxidoreductase [Paenibacillus antri]|uniref:NAD(P)/FAD-dependent oxidoreductase n=1 Tax=Paenibacillus antri TaxID=2582848 RepID=A0A5R9FZP6_9BACL|nr:NAD(P)/FAD-dependent oxidoreductase [Paenibacillus antri]TLS48991.1 NAD(P)/FAD-dependent oxidoreductase [Paenibacillus antri]
MTNDAYDCIVIGGGPSGLMAAVSAATRGARTLLIDKGDKLGRKLGISGGGRCNVTNAGDLDTIVKHIPGNGRFLYSAFHNFGNRDIMAFFEGLGIRLKEEDRGRMFPVSDKAKTVVDALVGKVRSLGVDIRVHAPVDRVEYADGRVAGVRLRSGERFGARAVVIATGGKSVPHTGSTGDGYAWAEDAGHTITELYPTEVPITSSEPFIREKTLQGISLRDIELTVWDPKGKRIVTHDGDMIFTHFGISGPAALRCSQFVVKARKKFDVKHVLMSIDLFPGESGDALRDRIDGLVREEGKKAAKNAFRSLLQERLLLFLLARAGIAEDAQADQIPKAALQTFVDSCKRFELWASGTLSIEEAFVTGGGVNLKEIDPKSMESKLTSGLFFCGEILDIHGYTGGYNITAAFATGYTAGKCAAEAAASSPSI